MELDPFDGVARADVIKEVRAAIAALPDNQRIAMVLARYHSLSFAEIADVVRILRQGDQVVDSPRRETLRARLQPLFEREAI